MLRGQWPCRCAFAPPEPYARKVQAGVSGTGAPALPGNFARRARRSSSEAAAGNVACSAVGGVATEGEGGGEATHVDVQRTSFSRLASRCAITFTAETTVRSSMCNLPEVGSTRASTFSSASRQRVLRGACTWASEMPAGAGVEAGGVATEGAVGGEGTVEDAAGNRYACRAARTTSVGVVGCCRTLA